MRKASIRNDQLTSYDLLQAERDAGIEENKESVQRQKLFEAEIKSLQHKMLIGKHRSGRYPHQWPTTD
jgi:hypothetical protein